MRLMLRHQLKTAKKKKNTICLCIIHEAIIVLQRIVAVVVKLQVVVAQKGVQTATTNQDRTRSERNGNERSSSFSWSEKIISINSMSEPSTALRFRFFVEGALAYCTLLIPGHIFQNERHCLWH